jgi:hypothetical protein
MKRYWLLLLVVLCLGWRHPFYVSVVEIDYNQSAQTLETSVRIFTDDFENVLKTRFPGQKIDLYHTHAATDSLISRYLQEKLQLKVNGKPVAMHYIGSERVEESTWSYFEIGTVSQVKQIDISNTLLYEYKKEQINMHHVTVGGQRKSHKMGQPDSRVLLSF